MGKNENDCDDLSIVIKEKFLFGRDVYYPICEKAKLFAEIANAKTLTKGVLRKIILLGYKIKFSKETLNLKDL